METNIAELTHLLEILYSQYSLGMPNNYLIKRVENKLLELIVLRSDRCDCCTGEIAE